MLYKISKFFLYLAPFTVVIVYQGTLFPFIVGKYVFFRVAVELALLFFLWAWVKGETLINADKKPIYADKKSVSISQNQHKSALWRQPLVIAVSIFVAIFLLAGIFGYNPSASFWSNFERGEGGLQMLHLFVFFILLVLLFRDEKSWRRMLVISVWAAGLVIAYGLAAALGISGFVGSNLCFRFAGSLGNPAYVGTYMIFALFYAAYLFTGLRQSASSPRKSASLKKWVLGGLIVLFFLFLIFSQTRGALLGLGVAIIGGLFYLFFRLPAGQIRKLILVAIIILIILGGLAFKFRRSINLMPFCPPELGGGNRILDVDFTTETFQTRLLLWKQALKITKERPLLGWGPENFSAAFEKHYDYRFEVWYDRAHNIFFDYLSQTGILGLLSYLSIFVVFCWQFLKKTLINADKKLIYADKNKKSALISQNQHQSAWQSALIFALPIAYLVQGIVLFEVLPIYINLFLFSAFAVYKFTKQND